jgi:hypothetical protein
MYETFKNSSKGVSFARVPAKSQFFKELSKVCKYIRRRSTLERLACNRVVELPGLDQCREIFKQQMGVSDWRFVHEHDAAKQLDLQNANEELEKLAKEEQAYNDAFNEAETKAEQEADEYYGSLSGGHLPEAVEIPDDPPVSKNNKRKIGPVLPKKAKKIKVEPVHPIDCLLIGMHCLYILYASSIPPLFLLYSSSSHPLEKESRDLGH